MIISFSELANYRQTVAMVDGCFDPLHRGHIAYFKAASELGVPLLCNIAPDDYLRTKHPPVLAREDRAIIIDSIRHITYTHVSPVSTTEVLRELQPRYYVKGEDWVPRLPKEQRVLAAELGIRIVFLPTVLDSSTRIVNQFLADLEHQAVEEFSTRA